MHHQTPPSARPRHLAHVLRLALLTASALLLFACDADTKSVGHCGDGFADPAEQCDGSDFGGTTCGTLGHYDTGGQLSCNADCTIDTTNCGGYCGDGVLQLMYAEDCEGDDLNDATCRSEGFHGGVLSCGDDCRFVTDLCTGLGNQRPAFTTMPSPGAQEDTQYVYSAACSDPDGDDVTVTIGESDTCGGAFSSAGGSGVYTFTPTESQGGTSCTLHLSCSDVEITEHQMQVISIQEVNQAPAIANLPAAIDAAWALPTEFDVTADDPDLPPDTLTYELTASTCGFDATINTYGRVAFTCLAQDETCDLTVRVTDNGSPAMSDTGHLTVTCANLDPAFTTTPATTLDEHQEYVYEVTCDDPDGHSVTLTRGADTCGGTYTPVSAGHAVYAFTPGEDRGGTSCEVVFYCTDAYGTVSQTASFDIAETNSLPLFDNLPGTAAALWGRAGAFTATAHDLDAPAQTFTYGFVSTTCAFPVAIDPDTGEVTWTCGDPGVCAATLSATDALGGVSTADLQIQCTNRAPIWEPVRLFHAKVNHENVVNLFCRDPDFDVRTVTQAPGHTCAGTLQDAGNGFSQFRFTPGVEQQGTSCTIGLACSDGWETTTQLATIEIDGLISWATAGTRHICALVDGQIFCYGENEYSQLGSGGTQDSQTWKVVSGDFTDWTTVNAGGEYTCAIRVGRLFCWGRGQLGQLGNGTSGNLGAPGEVSGGFTDWTMVDTGNAHTCAIRAGHLYCWGYNYYGGLGDGTTTNRLSPVQVGGGFTDWTMVATGSAHTCAIRAGRLYCWGYNNSGQIGDGTNTNSSSPGEVIGGYTDWTLVTSAGQHTCGIRMGHLYCWGYNSSGQLGNGNTTNQSNPVEVFGAYTNWSAVSAGDNFTCGIRTGRTYCWGNNQYGQLGNGTTTQLSVPAEVLGDHGDWQTLSLGGGTAIGIRGSDFTLWGIRMNLTSTATQWTATPTETPVFRHTTFIAEGPGHRCFHSDGRGYCYGSNTNGQINSGTSQDWYEIQTTGDSNYGFTCGLSAGQLQCWGYNGYGQLGDGSTVNRTTPTPVAGGYSDWDSFSMNTGSVCALRQGRRYCWGQNNYGQLGNESSGSISSPQESIPESINWETVSMGISHACGIRLGRAYCWGRNHLGQLGIGTTSTSYSPVEVTGAHTDFTRISAGTEHTCAIRAGRMYCWGYNNAGQLGNGTTTNSNVPVEVLGGYSDWSNVFLTDRSTSNWSCGVRGDRMYCWGQGYGSTPIQVAGGYANWTMRTHNYWLRHNGLYGSPADIDRYIF